ncbi:uncharacterized protein [Dysidea avara]|uniref:uncharacterized protein isoform X2 n=1 Tax=Dysidea avara TaxID=196820 RepID=UPI00332AB8EF
MMRLQELLVLLLLLLLPLAHTLHYVYKVRPYNGKCPVNSGGCDTLQRFMNGNSVDNSYNDMTLLFQPGEHHLTNKGNKTIIANRKHWTLQGQAGMSTIIKCIGPNVTLIFRNMVTLTITNIQFQHCGGSIPPYPAVTVLYILHCHNITMFNMTIVATLSSNGVVLVDTVGPVIVNNYTITLSGCDTHPTTTLYGILVNFTTINIHAMYSFASINYNTSLLNTDSCTSYMLGVFHQHMYNDVTIKVNRLNISNTVNSKVLQYHSYSCQSHSNNQLTINDSVISGHVGLMSSLFDVTFEDCWLKGDHYTTQDSVVLLTHCQFMYNTWSSANPVIKVQAKFSVFTKSQVLISNCNFTKNKNMFILKVESANDIGWPYTTQVLITNTIISAITLDNKKEKSSSLIAVQHTHLLVRQLIINYTNIKWYRGGQSAIMWLTESLIIAETRLEFTNNEIQYLAAFTPGSYMGLLLDDSIYEVSDNSVRSLFYVDRTKGGATGSHPCILQFISRKKRMAKRRYLKYKIIIKNNKESRSLFKSPVKLFSSERCKVVAGAAFDKYSYSEIGGNYTILKDNKNKQEQEICNCKNDHQRWCDRYELKARYPGQTVTSFLVLRQAVDSMTLSVDETQSTCRVLNKDELIQTKPNNCSEFHYTISSDNDHHCELYLTETAMLVTDSFKIELNRCPLGFSLSNKDNRTCQCDQVLTNTSIPLSCDINTEMILRPPNSWMYGEVKDPHEVNDYKYIYYISVNCPFDYCHPHSSHIHLQHPDVQCDFNRTGPACGHCPSNLSTIFGSSRCQHCTNNYLIIILPIAIAGIVLVLMMFVFNLTIVNGVISTFILYVNLLSINKTLLFPTNSSHSPVYVIIALANLDLGVEVCFYDGMDGYMTMWLQLAFPFYLIFIAGLLIIASRYSTLVQRVTAQRGLPVLATLFLLSYTKILITTCIVLFSYTEIITLSRSGQSSRLVWSVSTDVPLFGRQHAPLFAINLISLLILIPFNIVLLFNRQLARFRLIQRFKPLLDPYKAPYQDRYYYWTGYQLVIRTILLGITALSKNNNLTVATLIIGCVMCVHGYLSPFNSNLLNLQELGLMLNVLTVYVLVNVDQSSLVILIIVSMAVAYITISLLCHCVQHTCGRLVKTSLHDKVMKWRMRYSLTHSIEMDTKLLPDENWVTGTYEEYREPIVALNN